MQYRINSPAATAGGVLAAGGAIVLLCRDAATTGWTADLALMPLLVGLTVLAGHHAGKALRQARPLSAIGLCALAVFGSCLTVYEATGRRAEVRDTKVASAADVAGQRQHLTQMLDEAEENVSKYRQRLSAECSGGQGKRCAGYAYTVKTWEAAVTGYQAQIAALGAPKPVDPKAERVAALATLVGATATPAVIKANVGLLEPLGLPLFLELGSIVLFGYGLGSRRQTKTPTVASQAQATVTQDDTAIEVPARRMTRDEALADIKDLIQQGVAWPSQEWLVQRWGLPSSAKGTVSRWLSRWQEDGEIPDRYMTGRCKTVSLKAVA